MKCVQHYERICDVGPDLETACPDLHTVCSKVLQCSKGRGFARANVHVMRMLALKTLLVMEPLMLDTPCRTVQGLLMQRAVQNTSEGATHVGLHAGALCTSVEKASEGSSRTGAQSLECLPRWHEQPSGGTVLVARGAMWGRPGLI